MKWKPDELVEDFMVVAKLAGVTLRPGLIRIETLPMPHKPPRPGRRGRYRAPPPHRAERARLTHSVPHLTGSLKKRCHERVIVTGGRGYRLRSSFIRSQFKPRRRLRRESHIRQMRATW